MHPLTFGQDQLILSQISKTEKPNSKPPPCHSWKIPRGYNLSRSRVCIKNQTSVQVMPLRVRAFGVRELPWASNPIPHSMLQMHAFLSLCWTRSLWPDSPWVQLALWTTPTLDSSYHACQCYSKRLILIPNDQQLCWSQSLSTSSLKALLSTFWIPPLLSATHSDHNQHPWCKALQPKPQFYRSDPSSPSLTSALHLLKSSTELPQPGCWRSEKVSTTSPALLYRQSTLHPPSLLPTTCVFLDLLPF